MRRRSTGLAALIGVAFAIAPLSARAANADADGAAAQKEVSTVSIEANAVQAAIEKARAERYSVEQRLANGEILYRSKDYPRATVVFSEILEEFPDTLAYVDALWLRGETFYAQKEYLSARRDYKQIVDKATEPRFEPYMGRALARLIDVCLRINDLQGLDEIFSKLNQVPPSQADAGLQYAKGKAYYFKGDYSQSAGALDQIPAGTPYTHQARYFRGMVAIKQAGPPAPPPAAGTEGTARVAPTNYKSAIEYFKAATDLAPDTDEHRHVIDLSWMAIGRLFYEMESYTQAAEAYSKVGRSSPEFGTMLYELAWVYVRLGDVQRAERALEVLSIADPSSAQAGDATLLRADLLLRAGSFEKALQLYLGVREEYEPMRAKLEDFIAHTPDPAVYYEKLSQQQLDVLDQNEQLPPTAVRWAREAEDGAMAFAVIDDVNQCKQLIRQSYQLIDKLSIILGASNRVRAFPELKAGEEKALSLLNRISKMRLMIARGLDSEEPESLGGEIGQVRATRRALMTQMGQLPVAQNDFNDRDYQGMRQWNNVSQELTRRGVEIDYLNATINGLRRMLKEDAQRGLARDPSSVKRFNDELDENERLLKQRQQEAADLRHQIEVGRAQVGLGDARYQSDAQARVTFRDAIEREVALAAQGQGGGDAAKYAGKVQGALEQSRAVEDRLIAQFGELEAQVGARLAEMQNKVETERLKINGYNMQLGALDREAHELVGEVAKRNFLFVRDKIRGIVLRADVGITEQAWEVREEELDRVHNLQTERAREEQLLDEELREVLDDAGDTEAAK
ncbi:MAG: tetratricopeptide repeat protein [Labilithrix sp.]|nr:tetratricopeptide repeat protein [Labilithrix sp.]MCW5816294.1 tetratricopeptide repeat protein [Labilithrix sp.]